MRIDEWLRLTMVEAIPYRPLRVLVGLAILGVLLALFILAVRLVLNWVDRRLDGWKGRRLRSIRWQSQELLSEQDIRNVAMGLGTAVRRVAYLLVTLAVLQVFFALLPETAPVARTVFGYVAGAISSVASDIVAFLPNLATILVLFFLTSYLVKLGKVVFRGVERERIRIAGFDRDWSPVTFKILRTFAWVLFVVVAFPYFPLSGSPAFQGLSLFFGVLFSLGGSQMVANVLSGVMLTYMNAFRVGDRVRIADAEGIIVAKTTHVTRIRTPKNVTISVPNSLVMNNHIINFTTMARDAEEGVVLHTTVTIGYDVPWAKVEGLLLEAAAATDDLDAEPAPFVLQTSLDDFYVSYEINAFTHESRQMPRILSDLHQHIQTLFHAAGVEIASPHLSAVRDGNTANVPDEYLPKDYQPTAFRVLPFGWGGQTKD